MAKKYDAIVIGTGQSGPALASRLSREGLKTAVIERKLLGGTCVQIPKYTLHDKKLAQVTNKSILWTVGRSPVEPQVSMEICSMANEHDDDRTSFRRDGRDRETDQWALWLHLSLFSGYVIPLGGLVVPIVIWQVKKQDLPGIDQHGKNATNWILSMLIYYVACVPLLFVLIGIPLMIALTVCGIIFPIVAAIKGSSGEVWSYPLAIRFFS